MTPIFTITTDFLHFYVSNYRTGVQMKSFVWMDKSQIIFKMEGS